MKKLITICLLLASTLTTSHGQTKEVTVAFINKVMNWAIGMETYGFNTEKRAEAVSINVIDKTDPPIAYASRVEQTHNSSNQSKVTPLNKSHNKIITESEYSQWLLMKSDKPIEVRYARVKQEGNICHIKFQIRLNKQSVNFNNSSMCLGYIWHHSYADPEGKEYENHVYIKNSYEGVYDVPLIIPVKLKDIQYWDEKLNLLMYDDKTGDRGVVNIGFDCVYYQFTNPSVDDKLRCSNFKMNLATVLE